MTRQMEGEQTHNIGEAFGPRILVVDNIKSDVLQIVEQLFVHRFETVEARSRAEAINKLSTQIFDAALLDINLKDPDDKFNRDGLTVAQYIAKHAPETKIIFISKPSFLDTDTLLHMFNWNPPNGGRLAEAYVDKGDTPKVIRMVELVLDMPSADARAPVVTEQQSWKEIKRDLLAKVGGSVMGGEELIEPERQSVQILRRLAERDLTRLSEIKVDRVGRGRSRTLVVSMTATYRPTDNEVSSVVKIGDREIVKAERVNYMKWVPSFVGFVSYPEMTGFAASRQLAGIGYSMLSDSARDPARTFVDRYWELSERESEQVLTEVFLKMLVPRRKPRKAEHGGTLRAAYLSRFRRLGSANLQFELDKVAEQSGIHVGASAWTVPAGAKAHKVVKPTDIFDTEFLNPYWVSVAHGDLHGENIIVMGEGDRCRPFLIDFAHIGEHHLSLDYVVMEVSVRFHLFGALLSEPSADVESLLKRWMEIERWLHAAAEDPQKSTAPPEMDSASNKLARLARLVLWLRRHARLLGCADSYYNYYGSVGMATLVAPFLPTFAPPNIRRAVRQALLGCAAFCLHRVKREFKREKPITPLAEALESEKTDAFAHDVLKVNRRIPQQARASFNAFVQKLDGGARQLAAERAVPLVRRLQEELPTLYEEIVRLSASFEKTSPSAITPAAQLFLFSSLTRDLDLQGPVASLYEETETWLQTAWDPKRRPGA